MITQKEMIENHLKRYGSIEPLTALREYGVYRLGAVIFKLKHEGLKIISTRMHERSHITGKPVKFAKYTLEHAK